MWLHIIYSSPSTYYPLIVVIISPNFATVFEPITSWTHEIFSETRTMFRDSRVMYKVLNTLISDKLMQQLTSFHFCLNIQYKILTNLFLRLAWFDSGRAGEKGNVGSWKCTHGWEAISVIWTLSNGHSDDMNSRWRRSFWVGVGFRVRDKSHHHSNVCSQVQ